MTLLTRFARLCRADFNALLDRIEEPQTLLRLSLREMEEALDADRRRGQMLARERGQLAETIALREQAVQTLIAETALCLDAGQDGLARGAVRRRLEAERQLGTLGQKRAALDGEWADLQSRIEENRLRLESVRQKAEALAPDVCAAEEGWGGGAVSDEEVEVALLREKQNRGA